MQSPESRPSSDEIVRPVILKERQNFFDQSPFITILGNVQARHHMRVPTDIRTITMQIARKIAPLEDIDERNGEIARILSSNTETATLLPKARRVVGEYFNLPEIIRTVVDGLDGFPHWAQYIQANAKSDMYYSDGRSFTKKGTKEFPQSYETWLETQDEGLETGVVRRLEQRSSPLVVGGNESVVAAPIIKNEEKKDPTTIEITGNVRMEDGQNFFDQPPFDKIIKGVQTYYGLETPADMRYSLAKIAHELAVIEDPAERREKLTNCLSSNRETIRLLPVSRQSIGEYFDFHTIMGTVLSNLDMFPYWEEYVSTKATKDLYRPDGKSNVPTKHKIFPLSYAAWLEEKYKSEASSISFVLDETFPQQRTGASIREALPQGPRRERRKWIIRAAMR